MEDKIIELIEEISEFKNLRDNKDIDLIENEVLDSLGFIELVSSLEEEFNIEIQITEVKSDTWRSIDKTVKLVEDLNL